MIVVADTSPLNYLLLIRAEHVLPALFGTVFIPRSVLEELRAVGSSPEVRVWAATPPSWLVVREPKGFDPSLTIDPGEAAAIALAQELRADRLLMDDRDGRAVAESLGLSVAGTLGVIADAAIEGLVDFHSTIAQIQTTSFRASTELYEQITVQYTQRTGNKNA